MPPYGELGRNGLVPSLGKHRVGKTIWGGGGKRAYETIAWGNHFCISCTIIYLKVNCQKMTLLAQLSGVILHDSISDVGAQLVYINSFYFQQDFVQCWTGKVTFFFYFSSRNCWPNFYFYFFLQYCVQKTWWKRIFSVSSCQSFIHIKIG